MAETAEALLTSVNERSSGVSIDGKSNNTKYPIIYSIAQVSIQQDALRRYTQILRRSHLWCR